MREPRRPACNVLGAARVVDGPCSALELGRARSPRSAVSNTTGQVADSPNVSPGWVQWSAPARSRVRRRPPEPPFLALIGRALVRSSWFDLHDAEGVAEAEAELVVSECASPVNRAITDLCGTLATTGTYLTGDCEVRFHLRSRVRCWRAMPGRGSLPPVFKCPCLAVLTVLVPPSPHSRSGGRRRPFSQGCSCCS